MGGEHLAFSFLVFLAFCAFLFGSLVGVGVILVLRQSRLSPEVAIRAAFFSGLAMATGCALVVLTTGNGLAASGNDGARTLFAVAVGLSASVGVAVLVHLLSK